MFLRCSSRKKDGKEHRYYSIVENKRVADGRVVQRHVLYLGEINTSQELAWRKSIEVFEDGQEQPSTLALFPEDRCGASWSWIDSGVSGFLPVAKGRAGIKCCWCWWPTG